MLSKGLALVPLTTSGTTIFQTFVTFLWSMLTVVLKLSAHMQSKPILHTTGKPGSGDVDAPPTLGESQLSLVSEGSQSISRLAQGVSAPEQDLQWQTTGERIRDFTWDAKFPLPFVVVFSHAALTVTLKDKTMAQMQPGVAHGTLAVSDLPQGTSTHSIAMTMKGKAKEVCSRGNSNAGNYMKNVLF